MASAAFSQLPTEESSGSNGAMLQELDLEGEISAPVHLNTDDSSTLDEPIKETFLRDAKAIGTKFKQIFLPTQSKQQLLRDWDLWGPLIICVVLALLMQGKLEPGDVILLGGGGVEVPFPIVASTSLSGYVEVDFKFLTREDKRPS